MNTQQLGFIGLGVMGNAMALNLLRRGHTLNIQTRSKTYTPELKDAGAIIHETPADLGSHSNVLMLMVSDATAVRNTLFGADGAGKTLKPGSLVIIFATIAPHEAREIGEQLAQQGISCLDAPVSGGDIGARNATLTIMVGGKRSDFDLARPLFECLGKKIEYMGPAGSGGLMKAVNQIAIALGVAAMTESLLLAEKSGLPIDAALQLLQGGSAGSWALDNYAPRVLKGDFKPGFAAKHMLKDLRFVLQEAESLGCKLPLTELTTKLYTQLCSDERAELGNHALIKVYQ